MAADAVKTLPERIAPPVALALRQAGLEYLLLDEERARVFGKRAAPPSPACASPAGGARTVEKERPPARPQTKNAGPSDVPQPSGRERQKHGRPPQWPPVWADLLKKTRAAPVLWTYPELGQDLCGTPDPRRRGLVQGILRELAHPPGTHCFWPVALPADSGTGLRPDAALFLEGARLLKSRAILVMGSSTLRSLDPPLELLDLRPFMQTRWEGRLLIMLHSAETFIAEPQRVGALCQFLRRALAPFI